MSTKKEFAWDSEVEVGTIMESAKVEHDVKWCVLNGRTFLVVTKRVLKKDGWAVVKNQTFEESVFQQLVHLVSTAKK